MPLRAFRSALKFALTEGGSVKTLVLRSGLWVGGAEVVYSLLSIVRSVVLARLLSPDVFGLMSLALIALRAVETITRPGIAQALIARQHDFSLAAPTAFTMLVVRGIILASILAAAAPWIGRFYEEPQLVSMLTALSSIFIIGSLVNINTIAHQRNLNFRRLTILNLLSAALSLIVTTTLAYWMRSVWALVIGQIVSVSLYSALSYHFVGGRMRVGFDSTVARDLFRYGKFITGSSMVVYLASELDSAVIGKILGTELLGYYALALTIANLATANLSKVASSIMMPAYSKLQSDQTALQRAYLRSLELVLAITMPATGGLLLLAGPIIGVLYGNKWLAATETLQILAVFGLLRAMASFSGYLFEGTGRPKIAFQLGALRLLILAPLIVPMAQKFGLPGAAVAVTVGMAAQWVVGLAILRRIVGIGSRPLALTLWRPAWKTMIMAIAVHVCTLLVDPASIAGLVLAIAVGVAVYGALSFRVLVAVVRDRSA